MDAPATRQNSMAGLRQRWQQALPRLMPGSLLLCLAAGLVLPTTAAWSLVFYIGFVPVLLLRLAQGWRPDLRDATFSAILALCAWSSLAIGWTHAMPGFADDRIYWLRNALCTFAFLAGFCCAVADDARTRAGVVTVMIYGGAANALLAMGLYLAQGHLGQRMVGWGLTANPVLGAAVLDICLLLALGRIVRAPHRLWHVAPAILPMLAYLAFSFSRGPIMALALALAVLGAGAGWAFWSALLAGGAAAGLLIWRLFPGVAANIWLNLAGRGADCHIQIWQQAWAQFLEHPLIGLGPAARLPIPGGAYCPAYPGPHNLYLSLLLYSGLAGLALFILCLALLWCRLHQRAHGFALRLYLALGLIPLIVGLSDLSQIIKGPAPSWYILWLPALLILSLQPRQG